MGLSGARRAAVHCARPAGGALFAIVGLKSFGLGMMVWGLGFGFWGVRIDFEV